MIFVAVLYIESAPTFESFRTSMKTYLFSRTFWHWQHASHGLCNVVLHHVISVVGGWWWWWWFMSYLIDRQTDRQTQSRTDTTENNTTRVCTGCAQEHRASGALYAASVSISLQGYRWACSIVSPGYVHPCYNCLHPLRSSLCSPWRPCCPSYQATSRQPGILRHWSYGMEHPNWFVINYRDFNFREFYLSIREFQNSRLVEYSKPTRHSAWTMHLMRECCKTVDITVLVIKSWVLSFWACCLIKNTDHLNQAVVDKSKLKSR